MGHSLKVKGIRAEDRWATYSFADAKSCKQSDASPRDYRLTDLAGVVAKDIIAWAQVPGDELHLCRSIFMPKVMTLGFAIGACNYFEIATLGADIKWPQESKCESFDLVAAGLRNPDMTKVPTWK